MDFNEFRKQQLEKKQAEEKVVEEQSRPTASGEELGWVDGLGPKGPTNPKVKGFVLGRFRKKRIDPRTLQRPAGYETTTLGNSPAAVTRWVECCDEGEDATVAVLECTGCGNFWHPQCLLDEHAGRCCEGKAAVLALPPTLRSEAEIEKEKEAAEGPPKPKGMQKW